MLSYLIGIPLGVIGALVVFIWMTMPTNGAEPLALPEHSPEKLDEQWREIWNSGLDPVWSDQFGWIADGPSVINKLDVMRVPKTMIDKIQPLIFEQSGVRVTDVSALSFSAVSTEYLQAWLDDLISQFDQLHSRYEVTIAVVQRAQVITNAIDAIRAEVSRRTDRLVQRDATGKVVIDDYPQIGFL